MHTAHSGAAVDLIKFYDEFEKSGLLPVVLLSPLRETSARDRILILACGSQSFSQDFQPMQKRADSCEHQRAAKRSPRRFEDLEK
jgi:hypothetical protein